MEFLERYPDFETFDRRNIQSLAQSGPSEADVIVIEEAAVNGLKKVSFSIFFLHFYGNFVLASIQTQT